MYANIGSVNFYDRVAQIIRDYIFYQTHTLSFIKCIPCLLICIHIHVSFRVHKINCFKLNYMRGTRNLSFFNVHKMYHIFCF